MTLSSIEKQQTRSVQLLTLAYYAACALGLLLIMARALQSFLPAGLATQIGHNSEVFALALALAISLQFARFRWLHAGNAWLCPAVGLFWIALGVAVYYLGWDSTVITLNEPLIAAGLLTLYAGPRRPWRTALLIPLTLVAASIVFFDTQFVLQQAESLVAVVVAMVSLDWFDRAVLDEADGESPTPLWLGWYVFLLIWPVLMLAVRVQEPVGFIESAVDYMARGAEGFWGTLILLGYFRSLRHLSR